MLPSTIETQLKAIFDKDTQADCIAIVWHENKTVDIQTQIDGIEVRVIYCVSELAIREQLVRHDHSCRLVLLSAFDEAHLAKDVIARIWKNEPQRISPWKTLQQIIKVREFDPRLVKQSGKWMAEALALKYSTYQPLVSFGEVLDKEKAWHAMAIGYLGFKEPVQDIDSLFRWSLSPGLSDKYQALPTDISENLGEWFSVVSPQLSPAITAIVKAGHVQNLLPVALACSLIYKPDISQTSDVEPSSFYASQGRFVERYLDGKNIGAPVLRELGDEAVRSLRLMLKVNDFATLDKVGGYTEQILASLVLTALCESSDILPHGYQLRLNILADSFEASVENKNALVAAANSLASVHQHVLAKSSKNTEQLNKAVMALRLLQWLHKTVSSKNDTTKNIDAHIQEYVLHGGFVDWARSQIWSGDINEKLSAVYYEISEKVRAISNTQNKAFTAFLPALGRGDNLSPQYVPVENTLEHLLAPIAERAPVLLLVLDGMSQAVFRELTEDLLEHNWVELAQENVSAVSGNKEQFPQNKCLITAFPTLTEVSRCSLLSGELAIGDSQLEKKNFNGNAVLKKIASSKFPPLLFHKKDIQQSGSGALDSSVREKVAGTQYRVLGMVINAIDDQLSSSSQVAVNWDLSSVKLLQQTLEAARESGRVVVMTSDHGHVLDHDSIYQQAEGDGGERYHCNVNKITGQEVLVEGKRVLTASKKAVMPWSEQLRYTKSKSLGYHGGATLQELVIPLGVFVSATDTPNLDGWAEVIKYEPDWWGTDILATELIKNVAGMSAAQPTVGKTKPIKRAAKAKQLAAEKMDDLFAPSDEGGESTLNNCQLGDKLIASIVYKQQLQTTGRTQVSSELIVKFVNLLEMGKGKVMDTIVCKELNIPRIRLRGLLANIQKILNVEGYAIVSVDRESQTIQLNITDLRTQFEL